MWVCGFVDVVHIVFVRATNLCTRMVLGGVDFESTGLVLVGFDHNCWFVPISLLRLAELHVPILLVVARFWLNSHA